MQLEDACGTDCSGHMQHQAGGLVTRLVVRAEKGKRNLRVGTWPFLWSDAKLSLAAIELVTLLVHWLFCFMVLDDIKQCSAWGSLWAGMALARGRKKAGRAFQGAGLNDNSRQGGVALRFVMMQPQHHAGIATALPFWALLVSSQPDSAFLCGLGVLQQ